MVDLVLQVAEVVVVLVVEVVFPQTMERLDDKRNRSVFFLNGLYEIYVCLRICLLQ